MLKVKVVKMLQLGMVTFTQNSYILVEGTPATDRFYILQSGKVRCYHETQLPGNSNVMLGPGDFVGVIPCMTGHSQTETVVAVTNVTAIIVKREQYPELIAHNTSVAMKIIRAFSRNMRSLNDNLTKITLKKTSIETPEHLFTTASYFQKIGNFEAAVYGYYQYLKQCPNGQSIDDAVKYFKALKPKVNAPYLESTSDLLRVYAKGNMIFSECQTGADMFIIQEGSVRISRVVDGSEVTLALLKKGDMFGEMALLENKPRSACAIAHENCKLMTINRANFDQMVATQAQLIARLTTTLADRLWSMYRQLVNTQLKEPREKMVDMLALQIEVKKITVAKGTGYNTDLTPNDIAKLCGYTDSEANTPIEFFIRDQNVRIIEGKIYVPDVAELVRQAAFYRKQNNRRAIEAK